MISSQHLFWFSKNQQKQRIPLFVQSNLDSEMVRDLFLIQLLLSNKVLSADIEYGSSPAASFWASYEGSLGLERHRMEVSQETPTDYDYRKGNVHKEVFAVEYPPLNGLWAVD